MAWDELACQVQSLQFWKRQYCSQWCADLHVFHAAEHEAELTFPTTCWSEIKWF
jgi:hypothetical protein